MTYRYVNNNLPSGRGDSLRTVRSETWETQYDWAAKQEDNANIIGLSGAVYKASDDRPWETAQDTDAPTAPGGNDVVLITAAVADFAEVDAVAMTPYDFTAHFSSADTITYTTNKPLPSGITLVDGSMSGTPDTVETVTGIQVIATTAYGQAATDPFDFVVAAA